MTDEIIQKLNRHITLGIKTEADVIYLFVQMCKLIDRQKQRSQYPTIKFYRNWVVHDELSRPDTVDIILGKLEAAERAFIAGDNNAIPDILTDTLSSNKLIDELRKFFASDREFNRDISARIESSDIFLEKLIAILIDLPLVDERNRYEYIASFRLTPPRNDLELARAVVGFKLRNDEEIKISKK